MKTKEKWTSYENDYVNVINDYNLKDLTDIDKSNKLIDIAEDIQHQICGESDAIKFDGVKEASAILGYELKRGEWCDLVNYGVRSNNINTSKLSVNLDEAITHKAYVNDIHSSIKKTVSMGIPVESLEIPVETSYMPTTNTEIIPELNFLYKDCIDKRTHINKVLYKEYNRISRAFQYLHKGELNHMEFKILVDDQVYVNGGYPSPTTPPRTWTRINKLRELVDAMYKAGKNDYINDYLKKFGIEIKISENSFKNGWVNNNE